jgi:hypothetical protein
MDGKTQIMGTITATVQDKDGKVLQSDSFKMDSWVDNFAWFFHMIVNMVYGIVFPKDLSGTYFNGVYLGASYNVPGASGEDTKGIVVGTDDTAFSHTQVALVTRITHGSTTGKLLYSPEVPVDPVWSSTKWTTSKQRVFNNVSGASITVKEIGLYTQALAPDPTKQFMLARDVPAPLVIPNSGTLTVIYSFEITA